MSGQPRRLHADDRSLRAAERVRALREQDSRLGLRKALAAQAADADAQDAARRSLREHPGFTSGSAGEFQATRALMSGLAAQLEECRRRAESSRAVADEARRRWQQDRARLRAVQVLLELRAERRRADEARRETARLDELAGLGWLRRVGERDGATAGVSREETG